MNTKYFAVLFFVVSAAAVDLIDPFRAVREHCREKAGLTAEQLAAIVNNLDTAGDYLLCFAGTIGNLARGGYISVDRSIGIVSPTVPAVISGPLTAQCDCEARKSGAKTPAQRIIAFAKCLVKRMPKVLLNITGFFAKPSYPLLEEPCTIPRSQFWQKHW